MLLYTYIVTKNHISMLADSRTHTLTIPLVYILILFSLLFHILHSSTSASSSTPSLVLSFQPFFEPILLCPLPWPGSAGQQSAVSNTGNHAVSREEIRAQSPVPVREAVTLTSSHRWGQRTLSWGAHCTLHLSVQVNSKCILLIQPRFSFWFLCVGVYLLSIQVKR